MSDLAATASQLRAYAYDLRDESQDAYSRGSYGAAYWLSEAVVSLLEAALHIESAQEDERARNGGSL